MDATFCYFGELETKLRKTAIWTSPMGLETLTTAHFFAFSPISTGRNRL
jgi:hypothetical protein